MTTQLTSPWPMSIRRRPEGDETLDLRVLVNVCGWSDVEVEPVLADLRGERRTPGDEWTGAVRRADRGLLVLIPDQRPSERFAPEVADLAASRRT